MNLHVKLHLKNNRLQQLQAGCFLNKTKKISSWGTSIVWLLTFKGHEIDLQVCIMIMAQKNLTF